MVQNIQNMQKTIQIHWHKEQNLSKYLIQGAK